MKKSTTALAVTMGALLVFAGCSSGGADSSTSSDNYATVEDTLYGQIDIPEPSDGELTVVALGWSDAETALALGIQPVGASDWLGFGGDNLGVGPWAVDEYGDVEPEVFEDPGNGYDYEAIAALEPDVILNTRSAADEDQYNKLSQIAPTVYAPEGTADYATAWDVQITQVAQALGEEDAGAELIESVTGSIQEQAEAHPEFSGKTAVTGTKFGDQYGAYIAGDFRWDLLADLGFEQNPPVLDATPTGFYVALSAEQVSALDAEVAVMFPIGYTLDEMLDDPLISSLNVVQDDHVVWLEEGGELTQAFSAASALSIPVAAEGIADELSTVVG